MVPTTRVCVLAYLHHDAHLHLSVISDSICATLCHSMVWDGNHKAVTEHSRDITNYSENVTDCKWKILIEVHNDISM